MLDNLAGEVWKSGERPCGRFKVHAGQGLTRPVVLIRRLDCVLPQWGPVKRAEGRAEKPPRTGKDRANIGKGPRLKPKRSPFANKTDWTPRNVSEEHYSHAACIKALIHECVLVQRRSTDADLRQVQAGTSDIVAVETVGQGEKGGAA